MFLRLAGLHGRRAVLAGTACASGLAAATAAASARCEPAKAAEPPPPQPSSDASSSFLPGPVQMAYDTVYNAVYDNIVKPYAEPSREKLLPDWPPHKKGTRAELPTLVVSLDGCLIESQWTVRTAFERGLPVAGTRALGRSCPILLCPKRPLTPHGPRLPPGSGNMGGGTSSDPESTSSSRRSSRSTRS